MNSTGKTIEEIHARVSTCGSCISSMTTEAKLEELNQSIYLRSVETEAHQDVFEVLSSPRARSVQGRRQNALQRHPIQPTKELKHPTTELKQPTTECNTGLRATSSGPLVCPVLGIHQANQPGLSLVPEDVFISAVVPVPPRGRRISAEARQSRGQVLGQNLKDEAEFKMRFGTCPI